MRLQIDKLIYGGDGLTRLPADDRGPGKSAFVPFVLEGEQAEITLTEQKPGFARGRLDRLVQASSHRVQPACPYFQRCGGCHYQHSSYAHQLEIKASILRETLKRIEGPVDFMLVDIWIPMARPALKLVAPHLKPGAIVICDNTDRYRAEYADYFAFLNDPAQGFRTTTLPFDGGLEFSVRCRD